MIQSPLLSKIPNLHHAFGTRNDMELSDKIVTCKQVHGTFVYFVKEDRTIERPGYDILMADRTNNPIGIKTADCLPILAVETKKGLISAAHAGWRGTASKICQELVAEITKRGGRPENLFVALGPCISGRCYEVGQDVASVFEKEFRSTSGFLKRNSETKWLLDIQEINYLEFIRLGVPETQIDRIELCTHCRPDLFHSYRRDKEKTGRMVSFIELL